ncbi:MAG: NYN domain-containing protein [Planctomycetes bacterium]|nr:NYN domain-containing protein [Planctomycetota bacterium]
MSVTNVYVDGFNLYYGALKGTEFRWLDVYSLLEVVLGARHQINRVRYFTANVSGRPEDPTQHLRQQVYLRALQATPSLSIHYGHFLTHRRELPLDPRPDAPPYRVNVLRTEEKGSDVNLASHMLMDGFRDEYETAVVVSNDSDLVTPIRMVRESLRKTVGVVHPYKAVSKELFRTASFVKPIRAGALRRSQFPLEFEDARGQIRCPNEWRPEPSPGESQ